MNGAIDLDSDDSAFVEVDPTGRYRRYSEILGKGSSKTVYVSRILHWISEKKKYDLFRDLNFRVCFISPNLLCSYRAFDEYEGIEVAWNQVKLYDFLQSPEDLERLYCEIHLLKTLKHDNIMKFYTSWVDTANRNINFVTEMFTSGTLRQYRLKHKRVNIRAIKHWCRQILQGLLFLHSHDPPVIHRDLKCDNIFINGNQGEVKIGDLGLAAILRKSYAARCVGTPEFMAPEVYEEEYNELVDIYSFGMCILEMVTFEYPYSECSHPAQIYKKVISGKKPDALYRVNDPEVRQFVEKCLATVSDRHSAWELLNDPFLQIDDYIYDLRQLSYQRDNYEIGPILRQPLLSAHHSTSSSLVNGYSNYLNYEREHDLDCHSIKYEANEIELFTSQEDDQLENVDITIKGRRGDNDYIFLRLRIADKEGRFRNIYFPFDIETDTAWSVATEMIAELDITDQDVTKIAEMIDGEIASLVPEWKRELHMEESPNSFCQNCVSDVPMVVSLSSHKSGKNRQVLQCSDEHRCGAMHGRFEEITYQCEASEQCVTDGATMDSSQSDGTQYTDAWAKNSDPDSSFQVFGDNSETSEQSTNDDDQISVRLHRENRSNYQDSTTTNPEALTEDNEQEKRKELRWLKAKYQIQLRELRDHQLGIVSKTSHSGSDSKQRKKDHSLFVSSTIKGEKGPECGLKSFNSGKHSSLVYPLDSEKNDINQNVYSYESAYNSCSPVHMVTAKSFYSSTLLPHSLHRATSLPVDATDF